MRDLNGTAAHHHAHTPDRLALLRALSVSHPDASSAIAEAAALRATLTLPRGVIHVISDVHGEDEKLRHVINNASGALRQLVDDVLGATLADAERDRFLAVLYYPREAINRFSREIVAAGQRTEWVHRTLSQLFEIVRALRKTYRRTRFEEMLTPAERELFIELGSNQRPAYVRAMLAELARYDRDWAAVRAAARLVRNLACEELLVIGDLGDRGPRMDRVCETLMRQPNVSLLWGNHDMLWIGSHLGHDPCLLTMLRFSARYRRLAQLEEGYGIFLSPLEKLVREVYKDDPCERWIPKGEGNREVLTVARIQKAVAIMQFKAEAKMFARHPEWNLAHRNLLGGIRWEGKKAAAVTIDGEEHAMLDTFLPTVDPEQPLEYSAEEAACMDRLRESFQRSMKLREHVEWMVNRGGMWTRRDEVLMFHACVPVDNKGEPITIAVDGVPCGGRVLMDRLASVVRRAVRKRWFGLDGDADWVWYLWGGPASPLFGKDKIATFETSFLADKQTHKEHKNPYFELMHDAGFIRRIGGLFGCGDDVLVVNGHVPVKKEKGEEPVKRGGNAITIDGAFSAAYGDRGYTLVLRHDRIDLAEHAPFPGVESVLEHGADIVPNMTTIRSFDRPRTVADTQDGEEIRRKIADLEALAGAYQEGVVRESPHTSATQRP